MQQEKHISKPSKSPLHPEDRYHVTPSKSVDTSDDWTDDTKAVNSEICRWIEQELPCLVIGINVSSVSVVLHKRENLSELPDYPSIEGIKKFLTYFPSFAEDAGLSILLTLLGIAATLSIAIAVEDLSKNHMFRFRIMGKAAMQFSNLSVCFLGLTSANLLFRYGFGFGLLLISGLLFFFAICYGMGDASVNYHTRLKELSREITNLEKKTKELCKFSATSSEKQLAFSKIPNWILSNICHWRIIFLIFGFITFVINCVKSINQIAYIATSFAMLILYITCFLTLSTLIDELTSNFNQLQSPLFRFFSFIFLLPFAFMTSFCWAGILISFLIDSIADKQFCFWIIISITTTIVCIFSIIPFLCPKYNKFIFAETKISKWEKNLVIKRQTIRLLDE